MLGRKRRKRKRAEKEAAKLIPQVEQKIEQYDSVRSYEKAAKKLAKQGWIVFNITQYDTGEIERKVNLLRNPIKEMLRFNATRLVVTYQRAKG